MASQDEDQEGLQGALPRNSFEMLLSAINSQDVEQVRHLLESGDVSLVGTENEALYLACQINSVEIVKLLLDHGADVNEGKNPINDPVLQLSTVTMPIHCACNGGGNRIELVKCLIEAGCDLEVGDEMRSTALNDACIGENMPMVSLLIEAGADVNTTNYMNGGPLIEATIAKNIELMTLLLEAGSDAAYFGCHSIYRCIQENYPEGVEVLYRASKSYVEDPDAQMGRLRLMNERTERLGEECELFDSDGHSEVHSIPPLHLTCSSLASDPWKIVQILLDLGADINEKDPCAFSCLQHACSMVKVKCVQLLLENGVSPKDHSWGKLWKVFPPIPQLEAAESFDEVSYRDYLDLLKLLVSAGFQMDEESVRVFTDAVKGSGLSEDQKRDFTSFLTRCKVAPLKLTDLCRIRLRHCVGSKTDCNIDELSGRLPLILLGYLKFTDILEPLE